LKDGALPFLVNVPQAVGPKVVLGDVVDVEDGLERLLVEALGNLVPCVSGSELRRGLRATQLRPDSALGSVEKGVVLA
jgi:hypothetical protein